MNCDNKLCIYQKYKECTCSDEVEIDWHGLCKNMLPARITTDMLNDSKFYTDVVLKRGIYHFDKEIGEYVCDDTDFLGLYEK